jgi:hypothetical protein
MTLVPVVDPSPPSPLDADVAAAYAVGALAARISRLRGEFAHVELSPADLTEVCDSLIAAAIDALAPAVPRFRGRGAKQLLLEQGPLAVVQAISQVAPEELARRVALTFCSLELSRLAVQKGAISLPLDDVRGTATLFFANSARRAGRRVLAHRLGMPRRASWSLDLCAAWSKGDGRAFTTVVARKDQVVEALRDPSTAALWAWLVAADCWIGRINPFSLGSFAALHLGHDRWKTGGERFRAALASVLVVVSRDDIPLEEVDAAGQAGWDELLARELEWAASVLVAYHDIVNDPKARARFRFLDFRRRLEIAGVKERREQSIREQMPARRRGAEFDHVAALIGVVDPDIEGFPALAEMQARLEAAPLTPRERQVIALRCQDQDYKSIAKKLGISTSTVGVLLMRARRAAGYKQRSRQRKNK